MKYLYIVAVIASVVLGILLYQNKSQSIKTSTGGEVVILTGQGITGWYSE